MHSNRKFAAPAEPSRARRATSAQRAVAAHALLALACLVWILSACALSDLATAPVAPSPNAPAQATMAPPPSIGTVPASATDSPAFTATPAAGIVPSPVAVDPDLALSRRFDGAPALEHVRFLTSQDLAGRKAGSSGADKAADYIASVFKAAGLQPAGDNGTYFQTLSLPFIDLAEPPQLALLNDDGSVARQFKHRLEFSEVISGRAGDGQADGRLVFLGRGTSKDFRGTLTGAGPGCLIH